MEVESGEEALDITGEEISEGHVGTESGSLNAYGSPIARGQDVNRATATREDAAETFVVYFSELDLPGLTAEITAFCLRIKANVRCKYKSLEQELLIDPEICHRPYTM